MYRTLVSSVVLISVWVLCAAFALDCVNGGGTADCCCIPATDVKPLDACATTCAPGPATCSGNVACGVIVSGSCKTGTHAQSCTYTVITYFRRKWKCESVSCPLPLPEGGYGNQCDWKVIEPTELCSGSSGIRSCNAGGGNCP
jgi:hypothetical protein